MWGVVFVLLAGLVPSYIFLASRYTFKTTTQCICLALAISVFVQYMLSALLLIFVGYSPRIFVSIIVIAHMYSLMKFKRPQLDIKLDCTLLHRRKYLSLYSVIGTVLMYRLMTSIPFGMDWIGFAVIASEYAGAYNGLLFSTSNWWYSPSFPALVTHVEFFTTQGYLNSTFDVGIAGFIALLCGLVAAFEERDASFQIVISMVVGVALFAKFFDSGYPTVSSLIPISLAIYLQFTKQDNLKYRGVLLVGAGLIHPTGFLYLLLLYVAIHFATFKPTISSLPQSSSARLFFILMVVTLAFEYLLRMLDVSTEHWIQHEYGWQGGVPFLLFNGLLIVPALYGYLQSERESDIRLLSLWFLILYLLSILQFIGPLTPILTFGLLSQILYSMSLHAFHIPLAGIVALSYRTDLVAGQGEMMKRLTTTFVVVLLTLPMILVLQVTPQEQNKAIQSSDIELMERYSSHYNSFFSENAPWGYGWMNHESEYRSQPTVGLRKFDDSAHSIALTALRFNDIETISTLGIDAVLTSPMGMLQWYLSSSEYWTEVDSIDGSRLWEINVDGTSAKWSISPITSEHCIGCESRRDIWYAQHSIGHRFGFDDQIQFVEEGQGEIVSFKHLENTDSMCLTYITHGSTGGVFMLVNNTSHRLDSSAGFHRLCTTQMNMQDIEIHWQHESSSMYINPTGISGRGEKIVDVTGISLVAIETM